MLPYPLRPDKNYVQALVTEVDPVNKVCKVKTFYNQTMTNVKWLTPISGGSRRGGEQGTPLKGELVLVTLSSGSPVILGSMSTPDDGSAMKAAGTGYIPPNVGEFAPFRKKGWTGSKTTGVETMIGDRTLTSEGGSFFGVLSGGGFLIKSTQLAQILLTKAEDLVRIVARNYEVFTSLWVDYTAQVKTSVYRFTGYGRHHKDLRKERFWYQEIYGDTVTGDGLQDQPVGGSASGRDNVIRKYKVVKYMEDSDSGHSDTKYTMFESKLKDDGSYEHQINNEDKTEKNKARREKLVQWYKVENTSDFSEIEWTPDHIVLNRNSEATVTMDATNVKIDWKGTASVTLDDSQAILKFGSHYVKVSASGVDVG